MRPSRTSFSNVSRPTSRRTGSKQESSTASGVSSMMRLTPVTDSKARMLRPSRPMMRPFISSPRRGQAENAGAPGFSRAPRQVQDGDDGLAGLLGGHALDGQRDDLASPLLSFRPGLVLDVPDDERGF